MNLLIVESPIRARLIADFLPAHWRVEATRGHLRELPTDALGVDVAHDFALQYQVIPDHLGTLHRLQAAAHDADAVYIGTAPDREGEAIAAHLADLLRDEIKGKPLLRVSFAAITPKAVQDALDHPHQIDARLAEAQQTRRTLDRLIGYLLSPLASRMLKAPHNIGRVQMGALWVIVARAVEIKTFRPNPLWVLNATFQDNHAVPFTARLVTIGDRGDGRYGRVTVEKVADWVRTKGAVVTHVTESIETRKPAPPFTTATLLETACAALHLSASRVMAAAHILYEEGEITQPHTEGTYVPPEAQEQAQSFIRTLYGVEYVPPLPQVYPGASGEWREAIRPVNLSLQPEANPRADANALYKIIWERFIASQMSDSQVRVQAVTLQVGSEPEVLFGANVETGVFDGYNRVYADARPLNTQALSLSIGQMPPVLALDSAKCDVEVPPPYTESTLIAAMARHGIGRPATYATTLRLLVDKGYLTREAEVLVLTAHGAALCKFLVTHFPELFTPDYTAELERQLDRIADGELTRLDVLRAFWQTFTRAYRPLAAVYLLPNENRSIEPPTVLGVCPKCGGKLITRHTAKGGTFAGCEHFPKCDGHAAPVVFNVTAKGAR
jgi:DNA topoisomerase-1